MGGCDDVMIYKTFTSTKISLSDLFIKVKTGRALKSGACIQVETDLIPKEPE